VTQLAREQAPSSGQRSRRALLRAWAVGAGTGLAGLLALACGGGSKSESGAQSTASAPGAAGTGAAATKKTGGTLVTSSSDSPPSLDPYVYITQFAQTVAALWYSRPYRYKHGAGIASRQYEVEPELAASQPELTDGGQTLIVKLRKDVTFHDKALVDGRCFAAEDVAYSLERFKAVSPRSSVFGIVDRLETPDAETAVFKLKSPSASFISALTDGFFLHVVPKELVDPAKNQATKANPVGTGPWMFDSYEENVSVNGVANPKYFRGRPAIDKYTMLIIPEAASQVAAFRSGRIDIVSPSDADVESVRAIKGVTVTEYPGGSGVVTLNFELPGMFNDVRLRRAVSMAIDRDAVNQSSYSGRGQPATMLPPGYAPWFLDPKGNGYGESAAYLKYDPAGAKALMQAAGYSGQVVRFNSSAVLNQERIELLASMLSKVGFNIKIDLKEYAAFLETTNKGKDMGGGVGYVPYAHYPDPTSYLSIYWDPKSPNLKTHYTDEQVGQMIAEQDRTLDTQARAKIIQDFQRRFADQQYTTFLVTGPSYRALAQKVRDYYFIDNVGGVEGYADAWLA